MIIILAISVVHLSEALLCVFSHLVLKTASPRSMIMTMMVQIKNSGGGSESQGTQLAN
jgi:hypothetical protein